MSLVCCAGKLDILLQRNIESMNEKSGFQISLSERTSSYRVLSHGIRAVNPARKRCDCLARRRIRRVAHTVRDNFKRSILKWFPAVPGGLKLLQIPQQPGRNLTGNMQSCSFLHSVKDRCNQERLDAVRGHAKEFFRYLKADSARFSTAAFDEGREADSAIGEARGFFVQMQDPSRRLAVHAPFNWQGRLICHTHSV